MQTYEIPIVGNEKMPRGVATLVGPGKKPGQLQIVALRLKSAPRRLAQS